MKQPNRSSSDSNKRVAIRAPLEGVGGYNFALCPTLGEPTQKNAARLLILVLVIWGIWRAGSTAYNEWRTRTADLQQRLGELSQQLSSVSKDSAEFQQLQEKHATAQAELDSLFRIQWGWLLVAGGLYILGLLPSWWYWHNAMLQMGQQPSVRQSLWAYYYGHLGKYVPGKALVVVIRSTAVSGEHVRVAAAALAVFVETLTLMAVGGFVAAIILASTIADARLTIIAIILGCASGVPIIPAVFQRLIRIARKNTLTDELRSWIGALDLKFMALGWLSIGCGWFLLGGSLWATMKSLPVVATQLNDFNSWYIATGCAALALVAGFLSLLPGGVGVREWVVMTVLAPRYGPIAAFAAAGLLRIVTIGSELTSVVVLAALRKK